MYRTNRFAQGGITKGASHENGGIKFRVKSTGKVVELEGGEGVINKAVMSSDAKVRLNGQELTPCQAASKLNQMSGGGVAFNCEAKYERGGIVQYYDTAVSPIYPSTANQLTDAFDDVEYLQMGGSLIFAKGGVVDIVDLQSLSPQEQRLALNAIGVSPNVSNREAIARILNKVEQDGTAWLTQALGRDISREEADLRSNEGQVQVEGGERGADGQGVEIGESGEGGQGAESGESGQGGESGEGGQGGESGESGQGGESGESGQGGESGEGGQGGESGESGQGGESGESGEGGQGGESGESGEGGQGGESGESGEGGQGAESGESGEGGQGGESGEGDDLTDEQLQDLFDELEKQMQDESQNQNEDEGESSNENEDKLKQIMQQREKEDEEKGQEDDDEESESEQENPQQKGHDDVPEQNKLNDEESWITLMSKISYGEEDAQLVEPMRHDVPFEFIEAHPQVVFGMYMKDNANLDIQKIDECSLYRADKIRTFLRESADVTDRDIMDYLFRITKVHACGGLAMLPVNKPSNGYALDRGLDMGFKSFARQIAVALKSHTDWPDVYTTPIRLMPFSTYIQMGFTNADDSLGKLTYKDLLLGVVDTTLQLLDNKTDVKWGWHATAVKKVDFNDFDLEYRLSVDTHTGLSLTILVDERTWEDAYDVTIGHMIGRKKRFSLTSTLIMPFIEAMLSMYADTSVFDDLALSITKRGMPLESEKLFLQTYDELRADGKSIPLHASIERELFTYEGKNTILYNPYADAVFKSANTHNLPLSFGLLDGCVGAFMPFGQTSLLKQGLLFSNNAYFSIWFINHWSDKMTFSPELSLRDKRFAALLNECTTLCLTDLSQQKWFDDTLQARQRFFGLSGSAPTASQAKIRQSDIDILKAARDVVKATTGADTSIFDDEIDRLEKRFEAEQNPKTVSNKAAIMMSMRQELPNIYEAFSFAINHYYSTISFFDSDVQYHFKIEHRSGSYEGFFKFKLRKVLTITIWSDYLGLLTVSGRFSFSRGVNLNDNTDLNIDNITSWAFENAYPAGTVAEDWQNELTNAPVTLMHPLHYGERVQYKKFSPKNVGQDFLLSPSFISGVGLGIIFLGMARVRRNTQYDFETMSVQGLGTWGFRTQLETSQMLMRTTGFRITYRGIGGNPYFTQVFNTDELTSEQRQRVLPLNINPTLAASAPKKMTMSGELESAVKVYWQNFFNIYNCSEPLTKNQYATQNFRVKFRGAEAYFPEKNDKK